MDGPQRSQILMMKVLPSVEAACSMLQQEEAQRELHKPVKVEQDTLAMYSKGNETVSCTACGKAGHVREKCLTIHCRLFICTSKRPIWKQ